jgi:3'(2'), 5'-bisphosphate nucleotidase
LTDLDDHQLAASIAEAAGVLLVELRASLTAAGAPSWRVMDEGDMQAHHFIVERIAAARPNDAILSEEGRDSAARLTSDRVWVVDPLDGTNEYGQPGRSDWAVHIALAVRGEPVVGAVALPAVGTVYDTGNPPPYPPISAGRAVRVITSRSRSSHAAMVVAQRLDADVIALGSAGAKAMAIVTGDADIYAHTGGQYEWDSAAPAAVAISAGLHVSRIDGAPLVYNRADPWLPDLLICRKELADAVLTALWG